jgi:hypothetical protein
MAPGGTGLVVGRIVYFVVDEYIRDGIAQQRVGTGGNRVYVGDIVPALIVRVWGNVSVNLKLMLDGPDTYWATSVVYDAYKAPRTWHWMFEGQAARYTPVAREPIADLAEERGLL